MSVIAEQAEQHADALAMRTFQILTKEGGEIMKEVLLILGALAVLAYVFAQALLAALQPLLTALSSHLH